MKFHIPVNMNISKTFTFNTFSISYVRVLSLKKLLYCTKKGKYFFQF